MKRILSTFAAVDSILCGRFVAEYHIATRRRRLTTRRAKYSDQV